MLKIFILVGTRIEAVSEHKLSLEVTFKKYWTVLTPNDLFQLPEATG